MAATPPLESPRCPTCKAENRSDARFCGACGSPLAATIECAECKAENSADQRYCDECGAALGGATSVASRLTVETGGRDERKQVTVLFADVRGSMELAGQVSSERLREIMNGLFIRLAVAVKHYDGTVDKFTGDGIMAVFGAPIALEDHALLACLAASEMRDAAAAISDELSESDGIDLSLRVGLNSGEVVAGSIGSDGSQAYTAVGHAVGLAQRVESLSEPGGVWMSEATARKVEGQASVEDVGEHTVKGVSGPLRLYRLIGVREEFADSSSGPGTLSSFVGREAELAELHSAVDRLASGSGSLIGVVGSPGLGKSRLCSELTEHCEARGVPVFSTRCQAHTRDVSLNPLLKLLRVFFTVESTEPAEVSRQKIADQLLVHDPAFESVLPIVYDFLGVSGSELALPEVSAEARKRRLMAAIGQVLRARTDPVVLLVEDLHWSDPESLAFFDLLADSTTDSPTLFLGTFRPEFKGELLERPFYRQIPLAPLDGAEIRIHLDSIIGNDSSTDGLAEKVAARSGGNPFFAEEIVRDLAEAGSIEGRHGDYRLVASIDAIGAPSSVQTVLSARMDRLDAGAKFVLMTASVIGDEFRYDLLAETLDIPSGELANALHELTQADFITETELFPVARYSFRHPLTHEVAYESQLSASRAEIHGRIAVSMQSIDVERLDENAAIVAQHFEAAGDPLNSAIWHARSAAWAMTTDAAAAYESWQRVKRFSQQAIDRGEDAEELYAAALWMLIALGWRHGIEESVMKPIFEEACEIAEHNNDNNYLSLVCGSYTSSVGFANGDFPEAERLGAKAKALVENSDDPVARLGGLMAHPFAALNVSKFNETVLGCEQVLDELNGDPDRGAFMIGMSPLAFFDGAAAVALTELGRCAAARAAISRARAVAREHSKVSQTWVFIYDIWAIVAGRDVPTQGILRDADEALALAEEVGDLFTRTNVVMCAGAANLRAGNLERSLELFDHATELVESTVALKNTEAFIDILRGEALCEVGHIEQGLAQGERAIRRSDDYRLSVLEILARTSYAEGLIGRSEGADLEEAALILSDAERLLSNSEAKIDTIGLHRVRAELYAAQGDSERSHAERETAIELARGMDARGYLARLGEPVPAG
ncbi:MAG: AAA family ATPase [Solirubrobacterales bacterium]